MDGEAKRLLVVGWDGVPAEVLQPGSLAQLDNLRSLVGRSISGPLRSTVPPITIPAWTSMFSGRDPGELGLYGFRNRVSPEYGSMKRADSTSVLVPRLWDLVGRAGRPSIVVGVPQTYPPPHVRGDLVAGFDTPAELESATSSPALAAEIRELVGEYHFDASDFRDAPRARTLARIRQMTEARVRVMRHLLGTRPWDLAIYCEIGPDRMHHCFWSDHDPAHPNHQPGSEFAGAIRDYYQLLDRGLGQILEQVNDRTSVLLVSDHGAKAMQGGICINELLRRTGWLTLKTEPKSVTALEPDMIDWSRTRAWAYGGYYARVFFNVAGREPHGVIPPERLDQEKASLGEVLARIRLPDGTEVATEIIDPSSHFAAARGFPPDLMLFFGDLDYRSLGSVGGGEIWQRGNDTGLDEANHSWDGVFVWCPAGGTAARTVPAGILDVAPTALSDLGIPAPRGLTGRSIA